MLQAELSCRPDQTGNMKTLQCGRPCIFQGTFLHFCCCFLLFFVFVVKHYHPPTHVAEITLDGKSPR